MDGRYIALILAALYATGQQRPHSTQTTGIQNLDTGSYLSIRVPLPAFSTRPQLDSTDPFLTLARRLTSSNAPRHVSMSFKHSLITAAVSGDFDVSTANGSRVRV